MLYIEKPQIVSIYSCNEIKQIWEEKGKPQRFNVDDCIVVKVNNPRYEFYLIDTDADDYLYFGFGDYIVNKDGVYTVIEEEYLEDNYYPI